MILKTYETIEEMAHDLVSSFCHEGGHRIGDVNRYISIDENIARREVVIDGEAFYIELHRKV